MDKRPDYIISIAPGDDDRIDPEKFAAARAKWKEATGLDPAFSITDCSFYHLNSEQVFIATYPGMDGAAFIRLRGVTIAPTERTIVTAAWVVRIFNRVQHLARWLRRVVAGNGGGDHSAS